MIRNVLAWVTWGILANCCSSSISLAEDQPEMKRITVSFKPAKTVIPEVRKQKLSPELRALKHVEGGRLLGRNDKGEAVIETHRNQANALFNKSDEVGLNVGSDTEEFTPIKRLVLSYEEGQRPSDESLKLAGLKVIEDYKKGTFLIVEPIDKAGITDKTVTALEDNQRVQRAYPNHRIKLPPQPAKDDPDATDTDKKPEKKSDKTSLRIKGNASIQNALSPIIPSDPDFNQLWGMKQINAPRAWTSGTSSPVIVAVIDTGIDYNHRDLKNNVWTSIRGTHGYNALTDTENPLDDNGHGTHCAGTIAAVANNDFGVAGVTWDVKVMGLKFLDADGSGDDFDAIKCIDYAIENNAKVLSNSWGGPTEVPEMEEAIARAQSHGALFIAAASNEHKNNDGPRPSYPSSYDNRNIIAVMSVDPNGAMSSFSNYGARSVDLAAPGRDIRSTLPGNGFGKLSGTSMATPHVAGAAALLWGHPKYKNEGWEGIKNALLNNVSKQSGLTNLCATGGILDLTFMERDSSDPPPPLPPSTNPGTPLPAGAIIVASDKFIEAIHVTDAQNLLKLHIELSEECDVVIRADSSVTADSNVKTVSTGFFNVEDPLQRWQGSARRLSVKSGRWSPVVASYVVRLGRGSHDLYWKFWDDDSTGTALTLNAGTMTVEAIPVSKK